MFVCLISPNLRRQRTQTLYGGPRRVSITPRKTEDGWKKARHSLICLVCVEEAGGLRTIHISAAASRTSSYTKTPHISFIHISTGQRPVQLLGNGTKWRDPDLRSITKIAKNGGRIRDASKQHGPRRDASHEAFKKKIIQKLRTTLGNFASSLLQWPLPSYSPHDQAIFDYRCIPSCLVLDTHPSVPDLETERIRSELSQK